MATILLVDDVELFLELERSYFEGTGHTTVAATSGDEALSRIEEVRPDVVLLDLFMPHMDGTEVCRRIRAMKRWHDLPVIMVTAAGKEEEIRRCLDAGCDDYVTKPVNRKELLEKVGRLLGQVSARTATRAPVPLQVRVEAGGRLFDARVRDLSLNGVFLQAETLLEVGSAVTLHLRFAEGEEVPVTGKVKRVEPGAEGGMGIYLVRPPAQVQKALEVLVAAGASEEGLEPPPLDALRSEVSHLSRRQANLERDNQRLERRVAELETENREFAEQIVQIEEINNSLTNLYISSSRLHSVLNRGKVAEIIKEVIINFVGAEKFAILLLNEESGRLRYEIGEGFEAGSFPAVACGEGILGRVAEEGESYFREESVVEGSDDPLTPLAAIPLRIHDRNMGVLAVYRLFTQKERFQPVDYQLFSMLAEHAATALFSSSLYEVSERKRQTYRDVVDLLLH